MEPCCNRNKCGNTAKWCNNCLTRQCNNDFLVVLLQNMFDKRYEDLLERVIELERIVAVLTGEEDE